MGGRKPSPLTTLNMDEEKARVRKEYSRDGVSQKMMTFRVDLDVLEMLAHAPNKGRLINDAVREWYRNHQ